MKQPVRSPAELLIPGRGLTFANVAEGAEGLVVSDLARAIAARPKPPAVSLAVVCRDGPRMKQLARALEFFAPDLPVLQFPAWDCQPYDRVSPHGGILAQRLTTLARLSRLAGSDKPLIVLTTVNAIVQRVPAREVIAAQALSVAPGHVVPMDSIVSWLEHHGFNRCGTLPVRNGLGRAADIPAWNFASRFFTSEWIGCSIPPATRRWRSTRKARPPRANA